jgi:U3 small nucleolar RNA-associated protein 4
VVDLDETFPRLCRVYPEKHVRGKRRKRSHSVTDQNAMETDSGSEETSCTMCLRYNSMLYLDFAAANEMVVVEQPWLSVVAAFPEALHRRVYGN